MFIVKSTAMEIEKRKRLTIILTAIPTKMPLKTYFILVQSNASVNDKNTHLPTDKSLLKYKHHYVMNE